MGDCSHSDLTSQVLQKLHKVSTYWAFTKDRTVPHSNGQRDQNRRQTTPDNVCFHGGKFHPLLPPVPHTSHLGQL